MDASENHTIVLTVNRLTYEKTVEARTHLADFVRDELGLTGTHLGCEQGVCGSCTVLLDGRPVRSCLTLAVQADGREVETVEELTQTGVGRDLADALRRLGGIQCGFCTPGFLASAMELMGRQTPPSEAEVRDVLSGNICRCTGYSAIVQAVLDTAERSAGSMETPADSGMPT